MSDSHASSIHHACEASTTTNHQSNNPRPNRWPPPQIACRRLKHLSGVQLAGLVSGLARLRHLDGALAASLAKGALWDKAQQLAPQQVGPGRRA